MQNNERNILLKSNLEQAGFGLLGKSQNFTMRLSASPYLMSKNDYCSYDERYRTIKDFLATTNRLVYECLCEGKHPELSKLIFFGKDNEYIKEQTDWYNDNPDSVPHFFRTDEPMPGVIAEIQTPGSGLGQLLLLQDAWAKTEKKDLWEAGGERIVSMIQDITGKNDPAVIYLPKSSSPADARLLYQILKRAGLTFLNPLEAGAEFRNKIDAGILKRTDLLKTHSYGFLRNWPSFWDAVRLHKEKHLIIDVPPAMIFNMKLAMALPFDERFRGHYPDEARQLFPFTAVLEEGGHIRLGSEKLSYEEYLKLPASQRSHLLKSSSGNSELDDGGRGVFSLKRMSGSKCRDLFKKILLEYHYGERWVIQEEVNQRYDYDVIDNENNTQTQNGYARFSGFYGPGGLIARRVLFKNYYKVGGSAETVCAPVLNEAGALHINQP